MVYRKGGRLDILLPRINQLPYLVSVHKWPFPAISAPIGGIAWCGIQEYSSAQLLDFLELAENCSFLDRNLISALNETVDGPT